MGFQWGVLNCATVKLSYKSERGILFQLKENGLFSLKEVALGFDHYLSIGLADFFS